MINYVAYRKFVTLKNGKRMMFRFIATQDHEGFIQLFQEAPMRTPGFLSRMLRT